MDLVIALGGNALLERGQPLDAALQRTNIATAAAHLAPVLSRYRSVLTHGNGPQVGLLSLQTVAYSGTHPESPPFPLDILGAESEGMIGYVLEQELINRLPDRMFATLLTQIAIERDDPAFSRPGKPIGPQYAQAEAEALAAARGWTMARDGERWRRVVASPEPRRILELQPIRVLREAGATVICAGGGGIPVAAGDDGHWNGVEAVIDKDAASALLAIELGADALLMLTDVPAAMTEFGTPRQRAIRRAGPRALSQLSFASGSMGPKVDAAIRMARAGKRAAIGSMREVEAVLAGTAGTWIVPDAEADADGIQWH